MPEYSRVVMFDAASADAIDALVKEIDAAEGPPPGVDASRIIVLANQDRSRAAVVVRFPSEEAMKKGGEVLGAMDPPEGLTRSSVEELEILLERTAS
jgi:hypothetical protein